MLQCGAPSTTEYERRIEQKSAPKGVSAIANIHTTIAASMSPAQLELFTAAVEQRAQFYAIHGELYAARREGSSWVMWKLEAGSTEHTVTAYSCTCKSFEIRERPCKHMDAIRTGNDTSGIPWKKTRVSKRKRKRGPR